MKGMVNKGDKMPKIRDSLIIFVAAMDEKLQRDDDKKCAWETDLLPILRNELDDEYLELCDALHIYENTTDDPDGKALMLECADLANQAMMIFSQLHPLTRHNRRGAPSSQNTPRGDLDMEWIYPILKSWLHFFLLAGFILVLYLCLFHAVRWYNSILKQNEQVRKKP